MNAIVVTDNSIIEDTIQNNEWMKYFNIGTALSSFDNHISSLVSDRTPAKYTRRTYYRSITYFFKWCLGLTEPDLPKEIDNLQSILAMVAIRGIPLPDQQLVKKFIAHLLKEKAWYYGKTLKNGVKPDTVAVRYLTPLRLFLKELKTQHIPVHGYERDYVMDCKEQITRAIDVDNPPRVSQEASPMFNPKFTRLNPNQLKVLLASIDRTTLSGARNYALLRLMFESALRVAEVQRVTPNAITPHPEGKGYIIRVLRKRSKTSPVAISTECFQALEAWITMYNGDLTKNDPRRIADDIPVFQALRKGDKRFGLDEVYNPEIHKPTKEKPHPAKGKLRPDKGLYRKSIGDTVYRITKSVLGEEYACRPHDCRRTYAYIMWLKDVDPIYIKQQMAHQNIQTTYDYIGTPPNAGDILLSDMIQL